MAHDARAGAIGIYIRCHFPACYRIIGIWKNIYIIYTNVFGSNLKFDSVEIWVLWDKRKIWKKTYVLKSSMILILRNNNAGGLLTNWWIQYSISNQKTLLFYLNAFWGKNPNVRNVGKKNHGKKACEWGFPYCFLTNFSQFFFEEECCLILTSLQRKLRGHIEFWKLDVTIKKN